MGGSRLALVVLLAACRHEEGAMDAAAPADLAVSDLAGSDESAAFSRGAMPSIAVQALASAADSFFSFDPTLNPALDANGNAGAILSHLEDQLGPGDGGATACGTVTLTGAMVTAVFGTGCTLKNGVNLAGSATATVSKSGGTLTVQLAFSFLAVNDKNLGGTASFATSDGSSFTVNANLSASNATLTLTSFTVSGSAGSITVSGLVSTSAADGTTLLTFTAVTWKPTECYPSGGTLEIKSGAVDETVTFDASTPTSGKVTVGIGQRSFPAKLPSYGQCQFP